MVDKTHKISWIILDKELERFKKLEFNECQSGPFIHVGSVLFYLVLYPRGSTVKGAFQAFLFCDATQQNISKIQLECTQVIKEIGFNERFIQVYEEFPEGSAIDESPTWNDFGSKDLNSITITMSFKIMNVWDNNKKIISVINWNKYLKSNKNY